MSSFAEREQLEHFARELVKLELMPGQRRLVRLLDERFEELRIVVVRKGRRCGMTATVGILAAWCGTVLAPRFRQHVLPGEQFAITIVATSREQAGVALGFVKQFLDASPVLSELVIGETADTLTLSTGCVIEALPCSARSSRGRANAVVILDEAAHFVDSTGNSSLAAVMDALVPPLAQFGALGKLLLISTPLDASGTFFEVDQQAASGQFKDMVALHLPTVEAAPHLAEEAERERTRNPIRFAREWAGEFTSGEESFPLGAFDACVDPSYQPPGVDPNRLIIFGLDGAVSRDAMALVGVDLEWNLVYHRAWYPPTAGTIDHNAVLEELVELARRFAVVAIGYDPAQIHGLVLDGTRLGLPLLPVSQAGGRTGGVMARYASALVEALHARRLRLYDAPELREHLSAARFSSRSGGERLVKRRAKDRIDLGVALVMAAGLVQDLELEALRRPEPRVEYERVEYEEVLPDFERARLGVYDGLPLELLPLDGLRQRVAELQRLELDAYGDAL